MNELIDADYVLVDGSAWFTVKKASIRIHSTNERISVDIYRDGYETDKSLASAYVFNNDLKD